MKFFGRQKLGPKRMFTRDGALVCESVPITRTGPMIYGEREFLNEDGTPLIPAGASGLITVMRNADEVFNADSMASLNGVPIIDDHPRDAQGNLIFVNADNWKDYAKGTVVNVRAGDGEHNGFLVGDFIINDAAMIKKVQSGKRQVSAGYDSDYVPTGPGQAKQTNILYNHVAIVDNARCGVRCSIGDEANAMRSPEMSKKSIIQKAIELVLGAAKTGDEAQIAAASEQAMTLATADEQTEGDALHLHVHQPGGGGEEAPAWFKEHQAKFDEHVKNNEQRFAAVDQMCQGLNEKMDALGGKKKTGDSDDEGAAAAAVQAEAERVAAEQAAAAKRTADEALADQVFKAIEAEVTTDQVVLVRKTADSVLLADSFQESLALAEILAPGIRLPTFDRAAPQKTTFDAMCTLRRKTIDLAYHRAETRDLVDEQLGGKALDLNAMSCEAVRTVFRGAGLARKALNAASARTGDQKKAVKREVPKTPADVNRMAAEYYANHGA